MPIEPEAPHVAEPGSDTPSRPSSELWLRLVSGLAFAAIAFALLWIGELAFAALVLVVAVAAGWEWGGIVRSTTIDTAHVIHALATAGGTLLAAFGYAALGIAVVMTGAIIVFALEFGQRPILSAIGVSYTGLPAITLLWLRGDEPWGFLATLLLIGAVAITDTAAFASGRLIGGPKLAPRISPNKTWSGLVGGVSGAALAAYIFATFADIEPIRLALTGLVIGLVAQAGDLAESALKRSFGVKDASNLIPGHGGFLDRVDGLITAATAAGLMAFLTNPLAPAKALLLGQ